MKYAKIIVASVLLMAPAIANASCASDGGTGTGTEYADMVLSGEGGGNWAAYNSSSSALGAFQFTYGTLKDLGYVNSLPSGVSVSQLFGGSDWDALGVTWTNKDGIGSYSEFVNNQAAQVNALSTFTQKNLEIINEDYSGTANGVPVTPGGVGYASHFLGAGGYNAWKNAGYSAAGMPADMLQTIIDANPHINNAADLDQFLGERMAEGAGVDPSCINPTAYAGELPPVVLMEWDAEL